MEDNFNIIGEEVEQQEQQVPQQEEPPAKKLHKLLVDKKIYSKSFDEFSNQFSTPEKVAKLHTLLKEKNIYSKTDKEFNERFFPQVKKNDGGSPSSTTTSPTQLPSNPPSKSEGRRSNQLNPASISQGSSSSPTQSRKDGSVFSSMQETLLKGKQSIDQKKKNEVKFGDKGFNLQTNANGELPKHTISKSGIVDVNEHNRLAKKGEEHRMAYLWNKLTKGIGGIIAGSSDNVMDLMLSVLPESVIGGTKQEAMKQWRDEVTPISRDFFRKTIGSNVITQGQEDKYDNEFVTSSLGGLMETGPAIVTPKGARAVALMTQAKDAALQSINSTEEGKNLPESTKSIFSYGVGVAQGILEKYGIDKIFGKQSSVISRKIAGKVFSDLIQKADVPMTRELFDNALDAYTKTAKQQLLNATRRLGTAAAVEFVTGSLQEGSTVFAESLLNKGVGKEIFEPMSFGKGIGRILKSGAQEAIGGLVLGGVTVPFSKVDNYISEKVAKAKSVDDVNILREEMNNELSRLNIQDENAVSEINKLIDDYVRVNSKIPDTVPDRKKAADRIIEREELENKIAEKEREMEAVDVAFHPELQTEIELLKERVGEINESLVNPPVGEVVAENPAQKSVEDSEVSKVTEDEIYSNMDKEFEQMDRVIKKASVSPNTLNFGTLTNKYHPQRQLVEFAAKYGIKLKTIPGKVYSKDQISDIKDDIIYAIKEKFDNELQSIKERNKEVASELPDTYIINGKPVSQQEFDTAIDNAKNTKEALDVEYNGDDEVRIQKIIDLGGTTENGKTVITEEVPEQKSSVVEEVEIKNEGKADAPTKENIDERLRINHPFYQKVSDALDKLGVIEKYNPETKKGDVVGGYSQPNSLGGFSVGNFIFSKDGSISFLKDGVKVEFDKNGNVVSENTKEVKAKKQKIEIEGKIESIKSLEKTRDSEDFKYKTVNEYDVLGNSKKVKRLKTPQELKESTDKINKQIDKSKSELAELQKSLPTKEVAAELPPKEKVKQLRAEEQAEYDALPDPNDKVEKQKIYDKYDKLISPLLDKGEVKAEVPKQKEGKYETKAKVIAEKIMAAKVVPDWLKIDDENISIKGSSAEDLKKVLADAVINMGKLLDKGVEFSQAVKESVKAMIDIHGEGKRKEIEEGFEKYYRENEAEVPPPSEPPVDKTKESDGKDDLSEKGILNRLNKAAGVPEQAKKGFEEAGLKYKVASREEAQSVAKSIIDEFGIDQAVLFADANKFKGGVSSAIYAESLNRLYEQEQNAKTPKEKADIASKFAEISLQYDETSREKGRDISYIDFFYKKSPLGIEIAENARRKKDFDKWSKNKEQSWKEVFEEMKKDPEFDEVFNEEVRERMKKERAESRKSRIEKVDKFFDDAIDKFSKGGATYSIVIPPQVITVALKGLKKAYHAGENIAEAVQQAIDYISTELKGTDWDKEKFRKEWESKLADSTSKKKLTDEELKAKVLDKFRKKLKGLTESQKDEVIRQSHKSIIENGGLEFDEFKKIIARVTGRDEMTAEQSAKLKELVKDANAVDEAGKKARETRTSQSLKDYREAEKKAGKATRELSILLNSKPEILKRLTSIMQLNTLGFVALVNNATYNLVNQVGIRLPVGVVKSGIDLGINKIGKLFGKDYKRETDIFSVGVQREFFKKLGLGGREALGQFLTGLNRMDYIQKEVNSQQIRPITAILELKEYAQGNRNLTKAQIIDKALEATVGVPAEIVARALNLGDKPMRFAADAAQSAAFAKALGLKGIDYDMFMEFPREEAYRRYKEQGLSDAEASKKADYIKETIIKEGERSTFQQDNILNDVLGKIFGGDKSGTGALAKAVAVSPYIKIPSNAYWSYFNIAHPEVAFLQGLLYAGKAAAKQKGIYKRGLFDKENTSAAKDLNEAKYWIAHGVVGMATKAVIGSLVAAGIFRSSNDEDDTKNEREGELYYEPQGTINMDKFWAYMKGEDPSKVKGGLTIQNRWFGHWGSVGNSIAKREEDMTPEQRENQKEVLTEMFDRMSASFLPELEQGIFGNSSSLVKAMASNDWKQWGVNTINMFTNIVHPATAAQLSKAQLPYYAKVKSDNFMTELKNSMLNRSSLLRKLTNEYPPSKVGIWGDEVKKKDDVLMRMFGISKTNDDNFAQPIYEDYKRTNNTKFFPSAVKPEVSSNGQRVKLPADKALELEKYIGEQRRKLVAPYVNNMAFFEDNEGKRTYYKDLKTDEEKIKKLDIIYDKGFERGKELFLQNPENKIYQIKEKSDNEKKKDKAEEMSNKKLRKDLSKIN